MNKRIGLITGILILLSSTAQAGGTCGGGKIVSIQEGGWNQNDLLIKIDYSAEADEMGGKYGGLYIRFKQTLDPDRFKGIKALAYLAFSGDKTVRVWTSGIACNAADDIKVYAAGADYP